MTKEVIILTKSSKNKGYCVAGLDFKTGKWIRLVSNNDNTQGALSDDDMQYPDGLYCNPYDLVRVQIKEPMPTEYQPENYLVDEGYYLDKIRKCSIEEIISLHSPEKHDYLFGDTDCYITEEQICKIGYSLVFVKVTNLTINQTYLYGKRKTKASFLYNQDIYNRLSVTDPHYYRTRDNTRFNEAIVVISLPESAYQGNKYFKFLALIDPIL